MPQFYLATDQEGYRHLLTVATEASKLDPNMKPLEIGSDKTSIQKAVQELLTQADTARMQAAQQVTIEVDTSIPSSYDGMNIPSPQPVSEPPKPDLVKQSIDLDEAFNAAPVPHQLDLAALAMENARTEIINYDRKLKTLTTRNQIDG